MTRFRMASAVAVLAVASLAVPAAAAPASPVGIAESLIVSVEPADLSASLGESLDVVVTVVNNGDRPTPPLVVHIDITDPADSASVDPEDWTATLSKPVGVVEPGALAVVEWIIQPISGGDFQLYAVAISPGVDSLASSNVALIGVEFNRSLDPGGILPVAVGGPAVIGLLLVGQIYYARRRTPTTASLGEA